MADTTFVPGTVIAKEWLNEVNDLVYNFQQAGTGATARNAQTKLREYVSDADFGCVGDGVTNDTTSLTNFFNSAIANPGVPHTLRGLTYVVSSELPTINISNVIIRGAGAMIHNSTGSGDISTGCVFVWTGVSGGTIQQISSVSGAANLKITNIEYTGITFDCNSLANHGLKVYSIDKSTIEVGEINARVAGVFMGVVAALNDARDCQNNNITVYGRQVEYATGACLQMVGDSSANISLNRIRFDGVHKNDPAILIYGNDNNDWEFVRTYCVPGGLATSSVTCDGGASSTLATRAERFHYLTANKALYALGTESGVIVPATHISIYNLDTENGTPAPVVGTGASIHWKKDTTPFGDEAWVEGAVTPTSSSGAFTTATAVRSYLKRGRFCFVSFTVTVTTIGTAAGTLQVPLPFAEGLGKGFVFVGSRNNPDGAAVTGIVSGGSSTLNILLYNGTFPVTSGQAITISGHYAIA